MQELYTIASSADQLSNTLELDCYSGYRPSYQARPGMPLPVVLQEQPRELVEGFWGIPKPNVTLLPTYRILARKPFHLYIRKQRCAIPANAFFGLREQHPFLITLLNQKLFCLGGVYTFRSSIPRFAVLQTTVPDLFQSYMQSLPVLLPPKELKTWLTTTDVGKVMELADRSQDYWFDFFRVSQAILQPGSNSKDLLAPLGERFSDVLKAQRIEQATVFLERRKRRGKG